MDGPDRPPLEFQELSRLFAPRSIALVGASDRKDSIGAHTLANLTEHSDFTGELHLVNPSKIEIGGRRCWPDIASLPSVPDVVLIVIPAAGVVEAVRQAGEKGVPFAVILTSGFSEADEQGKAWERELQEISRATGIRLYGPNCPGLVNINAKLGMSFSPAYRNDLRPGPIALATQGGGLGRSMLQAMERGAGFAIWSSSGNEADLQVADFIHHMAGEPGVKVIVTLIEGIKDGPRFCAALVHAARMGRPVVAVKVGRSAYGARAAVSHTASITGSAEVNSAVLRQFGAIEVDDLDEAIDIAALLARKLPSGDEQVAVFASSGGAASLCADNVGVAGLTLAEFTPETDRAMRAVLPPYAAFGNPVDTTSITISNPSAFLDSLVPVAQDPNVGLVLLPIPMDYHRITERTAMLMIEAQGSTETPLCPIWMSDRLGEGFRTFDRAGITPFRSLRNMGKAVRRWIDHGKWRAAADLRWSPALLTASPPAAGAKRVLSEAEGKAELVAAGVPAPRPHVVTTAASARATVAALGAPAALKIVSAQIAHKSDVGGVRLEVGPDDAAEAFDAIMSAACKAHPDATLDGVLVEPMAPPGGLEVFVGVARDPVFGHVMTFGLGGIHVELFKDVARRMLPVTPAMARSMMAELISAPLLAGARGSRPRDLEALTRLIVAVSDHVIANEGRIQELDINPVWVGAEGEGVMALDAVIVVPE
jgi:acetate---CoA ligase (ADP-forming)